jgi:hypothetical protein
LDEINLSALHTTLQDLRNEIRQLDGFTDSNLRGALMESDWETLGNAASVVHRLMLWRRFPHAGDVSYLPVEPASVRASRDT